MLRRIGLIVGTRQQVNQTGKIYKRHLVTYWWYYRPQWGQSWWVRGSGGQGPDWDQDSHRGKLCPLPSPSLCRCSESCPHPARCTGCCWKNRGLDLRNGAFEVFACYPIAANVKGWGCASFCKSSYSQTCCFVGRRQLASCCFARSSSFPFNPHGDVSTCLQLDLSLLLFIAWIIWWASDPIWSNVATLSWIFKVATDLTQNCPM